MTDKEKELINDLKNSCLHPSTHTARALMPSVLEKIEQLEAEFEKYDDKNSTR